MLVYQNYRFLLVVIMRIENGVESNYCVEKNSLYFR